MHKTTYFYAQIDKIICTRGETSIPTIKRRPREAPLLMAPQHKGLLGVPLVWEWAGALPSAGTVPLALWLAPRPIGRPGAPPPCGGTVPVPEMVYSLQTTYKLRK